MRGKKVKELRRVWASAPRTQGFRRWRRALGRKESQSLAPEKPSQPSRWGKARRCSVCKVFIKNMPKHLRLRHEGRQA